MKNVYLWKKQMDKEELKVGALVELEHTDDKREAVKIAMDHLKEDPEYYKKLYHAGLIDEPKALAAAREYFGSKQNATLEWVKREIKNILSEYKWGETETYKFGQEPGWWKGQLAAEDVDIDKHLEEPAIVLNKKDNHYYLASVDVKTKKVMELHPLSKSKQANDICKKNWIQMYKRIHENNITEWHNTSDYKWISNPIKSCKR